MVSFVQLFIVAAAITTVLGQNYYPNSVTNGTQDYFKIAQAELLYKIKIADMENDAVEARFLDRLTVIVQQQKQILNETQQVNETLIPLQALSYGRKYCIQKYDSQFITNGEANDLFKKCLRTAENTGSDLTTYAKQYTNSAKSYTLVQLPKYLSSCPSSSSSSYNQTKLDNCYIQYVDLAVKNVQDNLIKAKLQRDQAIFNLDLISLAAVQCSFKIEKNVLDTLYTTSKKINDCIDGMDGKGNRNALN